MSLDVSDPTLLAVLLSGVNAADDIFTRSYMSSSAAYVLLPSRVLTQRACLSRRAGKFVLVLNVSSPANIRAVSQNTGNQGEIPSLVSGE
jgi:hypothetical protein